MTPNRATIIQSRFPIIVAGYWAWEPIESESLTSCSISVDAYFPGVVEIKV